MARSPTWVVQSGAMGARPEQVLLDALAGLHVRVERMRVVPFAHVPADPPPVLDGPVFVYGSTGILACARALGWAPGGWDGHAFSQQATLEAYGPVALNHAARATTWDQAAAAARAAGWEEVFVRPDSEGKAFPGRVLSLDALDAFVASLVEAQHPDATGTPVVVGPVQRIEAEWRLFLVEGRVVTSSLYAVDRAPTTAPGAPDDVLAFGAALAARFAPGPAFALDVARTPEGLRVVETNSASSAGFYAADVPAFARAITDLLGRI